MKILFMGTPDFAVPSLQALLDSKHQVVGVLQIHHLREQVLKALAAVGPCEKVCNLRHTLPSKSCSYTQAMRPGLGLTAIFQKGQAEG